MALTISQGNTYSRTEVDKILNDLLVKDSRILEMLPFEGVVGNSLTYITVATRSGVKFYEPNETWIESTLTVGSETAALKIMGGDADLDEFIRRTRSNIVDIQTTVVEDKVLALQEFFLDCFYYGTAFDASSWNGLQQVMTNTTYNTVHAGATTGTALSLDKLQEAIDKITGFVPRIIMMSKPMRRGLSYYLDSVGDHFTAGRDEFGRLIEKFRNFEIGVSDHISNVEITGAAGAFSTRTGGTSTSDSCTTIFVLSFGPKAVCGLQGTQGIETKDLGDLETKDARRHRIKWYNSLMFQNLRSSSKVDGILVPAAATNKVIA